MQQAPEETDVYRTIQRSNRHKGQRNHPGLGGSYQDPQTIAAPDEVSTVIPLVNMKKRSMSSVEQKTKIKIDKSLFKSNIAIKQTRLRASVSEKRSEIMNILAN